MMTLKIGIPKALLFHEYHTFWSAFFTALGCAVVDSPPSNKKILEAGIEHAVDDACLPVKLFHGHVLSLRNSVDYIFAPRITSLSKGEYICPKFCGLPEMLKHSLPDLPPLITAELNCYQSPHGLPAMLDEIGAGLGFAKGAIVSAYLAASLKHQAHRVGLHQEKARLDALDVKKIMVLGHPYNLCDAYANLNVLAKIRSAGVAVYTPDLLDQQALLRHAANYEGKILWTSARKLIGAVYYLLAAGKMDGIIYLSSFGCGIDSVLEETICRLLSRAGPYPYLHLAFDEHSGEGGVATRIEAFLDMLHWRDEHGSNIPAYG